MKKTILLCQLALLAGITHISAQGRRIDLETNLVSPVDDETIVLNQPFDLEFYFKNLGPDPIMAGDTLVLLFSGMPNYAGFLIGATKNVNDTIHFKTTITVTTTPSNPFNFCVRGQIYDAIHTDPDPTNNEKCNLVYFTDGSTGVADLVSSESIPVSSVVIYPNPANDQIRLNYKVKEHGDVTMTIIDMSGRKVMHVGLGMKKAGNTKIDADVSTLTPGMYLVEINEIHAKGRGRLLIRR